MIPFSVPSRHYDESNLDSAGFASMRIYDGAPEAAMASGIAPGMAPGMAPPVTSSTTSSSGAERPASEAASHVSRDSGNVYQRVGGGLEVGSPAHDRLYIIAYFFVLFLVLYGNLFSRVSFFGTGAEVRFVDTVRSFVR